MSINQYPSPMSRLLFLFAGCRPAGVEDLQVLVYGPIVHASKFQKNSIDYDQVIQQKTVISIDNTRGSTSIQLTNLDLFYSIGMHKWTIRLKLKDKNVIISKNEGKVFLIERPLYRSIGRWPLGKSIDERMEKNMKADLKYIVVKGLAKFETTSGKSRFSVRTVESKVKELPETDRSL